MIVEILEWVGGFMGLVTVVCALCKPFERTQGSSEVKDEPFPCPEGKVTPSRIPASSLKSQYFKSFENMTHVISMSLHQIGFKLVKIYRDDDHMPFSRLYRGAVFINGWAMTVTAYEGVSTTRLSIDLDKQWLNGETPIARYLRYGIEHRWLSIERVYDCDLHNSIRPYCHYLEERVFNHCDVSLMR